MATETDDFEEGIKSKSEDRVAEFEEHNKGFVGFLHDYLHKYPFLVPLIVLIGAVIIDNEEFPISECLCSHRINGNWQQFFTVVSRDHNADTGSRIRW